MSTNHKEDCNPETPHARRAAPEVGSNRMQRLGLDLADLLAGI